jgi:uncharacterized damage-inducible protein DinB
MQPVRRERSADDSTPKCRAGLEPEVAGRPQVGLCFALQLHRPGGHMSTESMPFITPDALLSHWQGHRRLTRRVIDAFPEDQLFTFSIGGMRPFGALVLEMLAMAVPMAKGAASGDWATSFTHDAQPKADILRRWDEGTDQLNTHWAEIPPQRFSQTLTAFGQYTGVLHDLILYVIDNEIHHRAQGYVYLRALGIEPPPFYERN